eukprot:TRINITY_DN774235_c0_g1_i1.p1 TRINITY_DN774235_c0_g1~~TRINITY_DN774235_c0_g1_i1.p1  ORF type:complete len:198 (+),score=27.87 TRINITY_DN774235_c0_g1_i1:103-696(+)
MDGLMSGKYAEKPKHKRQIRVASEHDKWRYGQNASIKKTPVVGSSSLRDTKFGMGFNRARTDDHTHLRKMKEERQNTRRNQNLALRRNILSQQTDPLGVKNPIPPLNRGRKVGQLSNSFQQESLRRARNSSNRFFEFKNKQTRTELLRNDGRPNTSKPFSSALGYGNKDIPSHGTADNFGKSFYFDTLRKSASGSVL